MSNIAFIGLGNMGGRMAANLLKAGHAVRGYDLSEAALAALEAAGGERAASLPAAVGAAEIVITMLPAGDHVRGVYAGADGVVEHAKEGSLLIDCSTIDVESARDVAEAAAQRGLDMVDAPVSGGVGGAEAATLTFMVGGPMTAFERAKPVLEVMGRAVIHAGDAGNGQAAKICNNMMLAIQMLSVAEGFKLAEKLGLDAQNLYDIASTASSQCWSMTSYCPVPGPVPMAPSNRGYRPGFATDMMVKDLHLAVDAANNNGAEIPLGAMANALYGVFQKAGNGGQDFSAIIKMLDKPG